MRKRIIGFGAIVALMLSGAFAAPASAALDPIIVKIKDVSVTEPVSGWVIARFKVTLDRPESGCCATVHYRTRNGTAKAGQDFVRKTDAVLTFHNGEMVKYAKVKVKADNAMELRERFFVKLFDASEHGNPDFINIADAKGKGVIRP